MYNVCVGGQTIACWVSLYNIHMCDCICVCLGLWIPKLILYIIGETAFYLGGVLSGSRLLSTLPPDSCPPYLLYSLQDDYLTSCICTRLSSCSHYPLLLALGLPLFMYLYLPSCPKICTSKESPVHVQCCHLPEYKY